MSARHGAALALALLAPAGAALAQNAPTPASASAPASGDAAWRRCAALGDDNQARLACFDQWAGQQAWQAPGASAKAGAAGAGETGQGADASAVALPVDARLPATRIIDVASSAGCRDTQYSDISRFWELESGTDCGTFSFRGYRPITVSVVASDSVNRQPSSDAEDRTAADITPYRRTENRIQLSVRTKIAQGMLTQGHPTRKDSLWFGYTQQSYWQLFNSDLSRPFRNTDHEPEVVYIYPSDFTLPGGWRMRYSGAALTHQSNGQSLPLSRSWNRASVMAGFEKDDRLLLTAKLWKRIKEDAIKDDNPHIENYIGRAELAGAWNIDQKNTVGATLRHNLRSNGNGSLRLEWLSTLGTSSNSTIGSGLRFHTQLFTGYGDSLIDFNRRRTVLNVGLSLVDF